MGWRFAHRRRKYRRSWRRYFDNATVGQIFQAVINEANAVDDMGVQVGNVWAGGSTHSPAYHFKSILEIARDSIGKRLSDVDFDVTPVISAGKLVFQANLYERKGTTKNNVVLIEGHNIGEFRFLEQGTITNSYYAVGAGSGWGDDRPIVNVIDDLSIATYGLREDSGIFSDTVRTETLTATAQNVVEEKAYPNDVLDIEAIDLAPAQFGDYAVGDTVRVMLHSPRFKGYDGLVRVVGRSYLPNAGTCRLVVAA